MSSVTFLSARDVWDNIQLLSNSCKDYSELVHEIFKDRVSADQDPIPLVEKDLADLAEKVSQLRPLLENLKVQMQEVPQKIEARVADPLLEAFNVLKSRVTLLDQEIEEKKAAIPQYFDLLTKIWQCANEVFKGSDSYGEELDHIRSMKDRSIAIFEDRRLSHPFQHRLAEPLLTDALRVRDEKVQAYRDHINQFLLGMADFFSSSAYQNLDSEDKERVLESVQRDFEALPVSLQCSIHGDIWREAGAPERVDPEFGKHEMWKDISRLCSVLNKRLEVLEAKRMREVDSKDPLVDNDPNDPFAILTFQDDGLAVDEDKERKPKILPGILKQPQSPPRREKASVSFQVSES